ncbi:Chromosome partition protein Smc [Candidatus Anstonella stagnisolia]|nr:Chromosome partition protein Smc [Candidatus Anstonella stagnisolia]
MEHKKLLMALACILLLSICLNALLLLQISPLSSRLSSLEAQNAELSQKFSSLQSQYSTASSSLSAANVQISSLQEKLSISNANLELSKKSVEQYQQDLQQKSEQLSNTKTNLSSAQAKISSISGELTSLESNINSSMSWFKENSNLPANYSWNVDIFKERILKDCVYDNKLNLACIAYRLSTTAISLTYKTDIEAGKEDFLQPIKYTVNRGGGDCEDYSLFLKATLNSAKESSPKLSLVAWASNTGTDFRVYPPESEQDVQYYYYGGAKGVGVGSLLNSFYVICYPLTPDAGHCTVAVSPIKINSSAQLPLLAGSSVFEPQNGRYLGKIGTDFEICNAQNAQRCYSSPGSIITIIADDDLYQIYNGKWVGYADYRDQVAQLQQNIAG